MADHPFVLVHIESDENFEKRKHLAKRWKLAGYTVTDKLWSVELTCVTGNSQTVIMMNNLETLDHIIGKLQEGREKVATIVNNTSIS